MKLYNSIPSGDGCGWGVAGYHLQRELSKTCEITTNPKYCDIVLSAVSNHDWGYATDHVTIAEARRLKKPVIGYAFHEWDIMGAKNIHKLPENYTGLVCGSEWMEGWCRLALHDIGLDDFPVTTAYQGVDYNIFNSDSVRLRPAELQDKFTILSGCKLEYRKGQDIVIESFKRFYRNAPEAVLLFNWANPWPRTALTLKDSPYITLDDLHLTGNQIGGIDVHHIDERLIPLDRQYSFKMTSNANLREFYGSADIGIFHSRCEAGTNLVLMESLASGIPCLISDCSGHSDLIYKIGDNLAYPIDSKPFQVKMEDNSIVANWHEACVDKIVSELMKAYRNRHGSKDREDGAKLMESAGFTWSACAKSIVKLCETVLN